MVVVGGWVSVLIFLCYPFNTSISSLQFSSKGLVSREVSKCKAGAEGNPRNFPAVNKGLLLLPQFKKRAGHLVVKLTLEHTCFVTKVVIIVDKCFSLVSTLSFCQQTCCRACPQTNILKSDLSIGKNTHQLILSENLHILSENLHILSENLHILSANVLLSANLHTLPANLHTLSANSHTLSAKLTHFVSRLTHFVSKPTHLISKQSGKLPIFACQQTCTSCQQTCRSYQQKYTSCLPTCR